MMFARLHSLDSQPSAVRRRGFSFVELLFAVLILGIGLIMIAAIFPVGLSQTKSNFDETQAAAIGRSAVGQLAQTALKTDYPDSANVIAMQHADAVNPASKLPAIAKANMVNVADPRYAWAGMYYRPDAKSDYAQVMVFVGNRSDPYKTTDVANPVNGVYLFEPRQAVVSLTSSSVQVSPGPGTYASTPNAILPGAYLVLASYIPAAADITITPAVAFPLIGIDLAAVRKNVLGRCYRIGESTGAGYDYFPGSGFQAISFSYVDAGNLQHTVVVNQIGSTPNTAGGFVLGRNRVKAVPGADDFDGPLMDVAYYTSFVSLK